MMSTVNVDEIHLKGGFEGVYDRLSSMDYSFFLDSSMGESNLGRYSFIGFNPSLVFRSKGMRVELIDRNGRVIVKHGDPFDLLNRLIKKRCVENPMKIPFPGGAVGYFAYDLGVFSIKNFRFKSKDDLNNWDCVLGFYNSILARDNLKKKDFLIACNGRERDLMLEMLAMVKPAKGKKPEIGALKSNFSKQPYCSAVRKVKDYIAAGDIYQANLSQRFNAGFRGDSWLLYKRLRALNPAPFAAYLNFPEVKVLCDSPERFLRIDGRLIETRPMKGTRPRGGSKAEDRKLKNELLNSPKDKAENLMIVDLERNDLGRVCEFGSVKVSELEVVETYPTVFQMVSNVQGILRKGVGQVDCLKACFPGGSITGAPKVRAMEIIDELEPTRSNIYTGAVGYLGFDGSMDLNIAIRTIIVKDNRVYFQVGGGIVADSNPEDEYMETLVKAKALLRALGK